MRAGRPFGARRAPATEPFALRSVERAVFTMPRRPIQLALLALAAVLAVPAAPGSASPVPSKRVVKLEESGSGGAVLASLRGRTLYSLSVEKHGRFKCEAACLSAWHPLLISEGVRPMGPVKLGTVKRPEGSFQVTYRGLPLYTFAEDTAKGETNGEGLKDVGTWHAARPPAQPSQPTQPEPAPTEPSPPSTPPTTPTPPQGESPPKTSPSEPPYQYPPYGY